MSAEIDARIVGVDERGQKYYIPRSQVQINKSDALARIAAVGAFIVGGCGLVYSASSQLLRKEPQGLVEATNNLAPTIEALQTEAYLNAVGDMNNENNLRAVYGFGPVDLTEAVDERGDWATRVVEPTRTPKP